MGAPIGTWLPLVQRKIASGDDYVRARLATEILQIDPANEDALSVLMDLIETKSKRAPLAIDELGEIGAPAAKALPILREQLRDKDIEIREAAGEAIERINPLK
jgi:HEAT repeat protein